MPAVRAATGDGLDVAMEDAEQLAEKVVADLNTQRREGGLLQVGGRGLPSWAVCEGTP